MISNTIMFGTIYDEVQHSYELKAVKTIAKTNMYLVYISFIARSLHLSTIFNQSEIFTHKELQDYLIRLPSIHDIILENVNNWGYWNSSYILNESTLPIYNQNSSAQHLTTNLIDLISSTFYYVNSI